MRTEKSLCRICEAHCGIEVDVDHTNRITDVRPDKSHPVSQGYACIKGTALGELHHDPDRVNQPLKKVDGQWQPISWSQAIAEIGGKVKSLRRTHGHRAIAHYMGNPSFFSAQTIFYGEAFLKALGSPNQFASHSIDVNNKFHVATEMYGASTIQPIPDLDHCDFLLCMGSNPVVSQMSVVSVPHALRKLQAIVERGGNVVFLDPRKTETARKVGQHFFVRPGSDAYFLMAMLHVVAHELPLDKAKVEKHLQGLQRFVDVAQPWTPERCAPLCGVSAADIRDIGKQFVKAQGASIYLSTGVNMGPFSSLCFWLAQGINAITGNLDHRGGTLIPHGPFDSIKLSKQLGLSGFGDDRTLVRSWHKVAGAFPVAALAEEITVEHPERIRALFVTAGNPLHSVPGNALRAAVEKLDLLVCTDIYMSETAQQADYVLPATDMLERSDYPVSHANLQLTPYAQFAHAVVPPLHERKPEWWIFSELAKASGAKFFGKSILNFAPRLNAIAQRLRLGEPITPDRVIAILLRSGGQVSLQALKQQPQGLPLAANKPGSFLGKRLLTESGRVNLAPERLLNDCQRLAANEAAFLVDSDNLQVIGRRERRSHNSWMHNNRKINHESGNVVMMHPDDAKPRELQLGDCVRIGSRQQGFIELPVKISSEIMPGVISVPHGWGHAQSGGDKARRLPGANINQVLPEAAENMDPVSGQAIMLGHRLSVVKVSATKPRRRTTSPRGQAQLDLG